MNSHWFPPRELGNALDFVFDSVQGDFEQQAAQYRKLDLNYIQLSRGKFRGRMFSAQLGSISIYLEHCNQAIEKQIALPPGMFSFCMTLKEAGSVEIYGVANSGDCVQIIPPNGENVIICPADSALLVFTLDRQALLHNEELLPEVVDWLAGLGRGGAVVKSARLAQRLRTDITSALEGAAIATTDEKRAAMDRATVFSVASALTMEWLTLDTMETFRSTTAYERFRSARNLLLNDANEFGLQGGRSFQHLGSKRSVEKAFTDHVFMGPLAYARVIRLHNARRKLRDRNRFSDSIGDIAAEEGFWDASRFSAYYRRHFGELPSVTRDRLAERIPAQANEPDASGVQPLRRRALRSASVSPL